MDTNPKVTRLSSDMDATAAPSDPHLGAPEGWPASPIADALYAVLRATPETRVAIARRLELSRLEPGTRRVFSGAVEDARLVVVVAPGSACACSQSQRAFSRSRRSLARMASACFGDGVNGAVPVITAIGQRAGRNAYGRA